LTTRSYRLSTRSYRPLSAWIVLGILIAVAAPAVRGGQATQPDDERVQEVIGGLHSNDYQRRQAAIKEVVAIGEPAVPALLETIFDPGQGSFEAQSALRLMGPKAKAALPRLLELAQARPSSQPASSQPGPSPRLTALIVLQGMGWASKELIPVFQKIAEDTQEEERVRTIAVSGLWRMGKDAVPILRRYADGPADSFRETARSVLAALLHEQGIQTCGEYYTALIEADMFSPRVSEYLMRTRGNANAAGSLHPLTEKVKAAYRTRLKEKPDPGLCLTLAKIIQYQLAGTAIEWAAPTDSWTSQRSREAPMESYVTMAELLTSGFELAEKGSELRQTIGVGLAKLRLLQGDWEGMNRVLGQLGWELIPAESRSLLAAPPVQWDKDLSKQWKACDEQMRSGDCGLVLHVEKDGKGLRGVHVLVKKWKAPGRVWATGISTDTLFFAPQPLALFENESFGYGGQVRAMTRYEVTDDTGEVKFEKLPDIEIKIEVLVPTGNFPEAGRGWDLWMETAPAEMKRAAVGGSDVVDRSKVPAVAELESGKTVRYPRLVVLPQLNLDIDDWSEADPRAFEIGWPTLSAKPGEQITYELEMMLTGPSAQPEIADYIQSIESSKETLSTNRWAVGANGVGGKKLYPGNMYAFGVVALDKSGKILSRSPKKRVWVPWGYRPCEPPVVGSDTYRLSPIQVETWFRGSFDYGDGRSENLEEKVARQLREYPKTFEREYVEVGKAWLDWHAGRKGDAETQLKKLVKDLPEGSVPRNTAVWLLGQVKEDKSPPKRLTLVGSSGVPLEEKPASRPVDDAGGRRRR
jgi:hypothetical protein